MWTIGDIVDFLFRLLVSAQSRRMPLGAPTTTRTKPLLARSHKEQNVATKEEPEKGPRGHTTGHFGGRSR